MRPEDVPATDLRRRLVAAEVSSHTMRGCCGPTAEQAADVAVAVVYDWLREHLEQLAGVHADAGEFLGDMIGDLSVAQPQVNVAVSFDEVRHVIGDPQPEPGSVELTQPTRCAGCGDLLEVGAAVRPQGRGVAGECCT